MSTDIRELLDVAADDSGRSTIDADALVARGRRKVRTRRAGAAVCAAAVLVAAVVGVSQLPTLRSDAPVPPAATPTQTAGTEEAGPAGVFKPLPGVRPGDAALASVSMSEALRRCQLKWSAEVGHDVGGLEFLSGQPIEGSVPPMFRPGDVLLVDSDVKAPGYTCVIPGDSQPGKDQLAEVDKTSIASDDRSVLRRCSSTLWHDLTGWKLLSKRVEPGALGAAVAVSPSGKFVARCFLGGPKAIKAVVGGSMIITQQPVPASVNERYAYGGAVFDAAFQTCEVEGVTCAGWLFHSIRRLPLNVAKLKIESNGRSTAVAVKQGWYATAWADGDKKSVGPRLKVTAYRADGSVISTFDGGPFVR